MNPKQKMSLKNVNDCVREEICRNIIQVAQALLFSRDSSYSIYVAQVIMQVNSEVKYFTGQTSSISFPHALRSIADWFLNIAICRYDWWAPWRSAVLAQAAASLVQWSKQWGMSTFGLLPMKYYPLEEDMTTFCGWKFAHKQLSLYSPTSNGSFRKCSDTHVKFMCLSVL